MATARSAVSRTGLHSGYYSKAGTSIYGSAEGHTGENQPAVLDVLLKRTPGMWVEYKLRLPQREAAWRGLQES